MPDPWDDRSGHLHKGRWKLTLWAGDPGGAVGKSSLSRLLMSDHVRVWSLESPWGRSDVLSRLHSVFFSLR